MYGIKMVFSSRYLAKDKICRNKVPSFSLDKVLLFYKMQSFIIDVKGAICCVYTALFTFS